MILSTVSTFGQFWNKPNAQYTFSYIQPNPFYEIGFKQLTIDSDTLIDGKLFTRYREYSVTYNGATWVAYDPIHLDTISTLTSIAFYEEDSVLYGHNVNWDGNEVDNLYNFAALPGESWTIPQRFLNAIDSWNYYCDSIITITVLDTGHVEYQGELLYFLKVEYEGLENYVSSSTDTIFERFGSKKFGFLSISKHCYEDGPPALQQGGFYELTCYSDDQISFGEDCFNINYLGVDEVTIIAPSVYPNPASEWVTVRTNNHTVSMNDIRGNELGVFKVLNGETKINLTEFATGVYIIRGAGGGAAKLIVQH